MHVRTALLGLATLASLGLLAGGPAYAADLCEAHPKAQWMKPDAIRSKAEAMGYEVRKVDEEDGCWEVKWTKEGKRVEAYFDPVTGDVVKVMSES